MGCPRQTRFAEVASDLLLGIWQQIGPVWNVQGFATRACFARGGVAVKQPLRILPAERHTGTGYDTQLAQPHTICHRIDRVSELLTRCENAPYKPANPDETSSRFGGLDRRSSV